MEWAILWYALLRYVPSTTLTFRRMHACGDHTTSSEDLNIPMATVKMDWAEQLDPAYAAARAKSGASV